MNSARNRSNPSRRVKDLQPNHANLNRLERNPSQSFAGCGEGFVKDSAGRKSLNNRYISLFSINPSRVHAPARACAVRPRTRERGGGGIDFREGLPAAPLVTPPRPARHVPASLAHVGDVAPRRHVDPTVRADAIRGHTLAHGGPSGCARAGQWFLPGRKSQEMAVGTDAISSRVCFPSPNVPKGDNPCLIPTTPTQSATRFGRTSSSPPPAAWKGSSGTLSGSW